MPMVSMSSPAFITQSRLDLVTEFDSSTRFSNPDPPSLLRTQFSRVHGNAVPLSTRLLRDGRWLVDS